MLDILTKDELKVLDPKKPHTTKKIEYVTAYVRQWLFVMTGDALNKTHINFVDCMCNAGIYADGDLATATEVFKLFNEFAKNHPTKQFRLFLNDYNSIRIDIIARICDTIKNDSLSNISFFTNVGDVNEYISNLSKQENLTGFSTSTILYVDPYDFGTVNIPTLKKFTDTNYCELIYNVFTSDFVRNKFDSRISKCLDDENAKFTTKEQLVEYMVTLLKRDSKFKYHLAYEFKTQTNAELYQIMFFTPNSAGLDKIKEALWETFNGQFSHRNKAQDNSGQIQMFTADDDRQMLLNMHSAEAKNLLLQKYKGQKDIHYDVWVDYILSNSMLKSSYILNNLLKPLIASGQIIKLNKGVIKSNFKKDFYDFNGGES